LKVEDLNLFKKEQETNLEQILNQIEQCKKDITDLAQTKVDVTEFEAKKLDDKLIFKQNNEVMDEFSNEFLRLENFIEKYVPLKI